MQSAIKVSVPQLRLLEGPLLSWKGGSVEAIAVGVATPETIAFSQLAFVSDLNFLSSALEKASLLIIEDKILPPSLALKPLQAAWKTPSVKSAMILVLPLFDPRLRAREDGVSSEAFVHPTARIGSGSRIAAGVSIGAHAVIGNSCDIHPGAVIEEFCQIGSRCVIHAGAVIGSDGFGFATDSQGQHHKVPQIGIVVLEDDVEIGAGCAIDRATIGETRIKQGTKFDNLCHVAHNCQIGRHSLFAAGFFCAGSTTIGDHFTCGGGVVISDHVNICDRVMLAGRSTVTKDITKPGAYMGYPLEQLRDGLKTTQNLTHLTRMRRQLQRISKKLGMSDDSE